MDEPSSSRRIPSRFQIGDSVAHAGKRCEVVGIHFTIDKVFYDIATANGVRTSIPGHELSIPFEVVK